jgi:3-oxoacyl-[acyl-carrier protein] reductase
VNAVAPGFVVSPMTDPLPQNVKDALLARIPLARMGCDAEVAAAIVFLASEEAGYITGAVLDVNGGLRMG